MSFFKRGGITRPKFREMLRKSSSVIPGSGGKMYSRQERIEMEKKIFPSKRFGSDISDRETEKRFKELRKEAHNADTQEKRTAINRNIRFLKNVIGVKRY